MRLLRTCFLSLAFIGTLVSMMGQEHSRATELNEILLDAIRRDLARPTIHARNLFHSSVAMYDIWSLYNQEGRPFFMRDTVQGFIFELGEISIPENAAELQSAQEIAMTYAVYRLLSHRFLYAPRFNEIVALLTEMMVTYRYDINITSTDYLNDDNPAVLGNYIASKIIEFGNQDGANELGLYRNQRYRPINGALILKQSENFSIADPNRWQPLAFDIFIDQSGNVRPSGVPEFVSPEWGDVVPFALDINESEIFTRSGNDEYRVYKDPGPPPYISDEGNDEGSLDYKWGFSLVSVWSSMLDPEDGVMLDISPASLGNLDNLPESPAEYRAFYNLFEGGDIATGHPKNPITGEPYAPQLVPRGDYARVLAEFWADGPDSETPPGHWFTILNKVKEDPLFTYQWMGQGAALDPLEYDVKAFLTLSGALHDAAIATWSIKGWYDYLRPISAIRYMAQQGQSSIDSLLNYHVHGIPLIPDFIEIVEEGDPLALMDSTNIGKIKVYSWKGPSYIENEETEVAGVGWILAQDWWPYQRPTFVTPPFAGYLSGHSTFSRAAAEVMTFMTGDAFFPGGMGTFLAPKDEFLVFEDGPSVDIELQWATYRDASDQTSLSRIWGGIHPPADDIPGRKIGIEIAIDAFNLANTYFKNTTTANIDLPLVEDACKVFPNPLASNGRINIELQGNAFDVKELRVELRDPVGRLLRSEILRPGELYLEIEGLDPGTYFLQLNDGFRRQLETIIIQ